MNRSDDASGSWASVQTATRGLQVLRAFRSERLPLSHTELVRRTGLSKATVSRLTTTLLQLGFLNRVDGGRLFELAPVPLGMGHALIESSELLRKVRPALQHMADRQVALAALGVPNGLDMLYVAYQASPRVATLRLGVGSVLQMGKTAIGLAYLWALPPTEQAAQIGRILDHAGQDTALLEQRIRDGFAELDSQGVCCVADGALRDTFGIALPLRLGRQGVLMGLSCGRAVVGPDLAAERKRIVPDLKRTAIQIQDLLAECDGQP